MKKKEKKNIKHIHIFTTQSLSSGGQKVGAHRFQGNRIRSINVRPYMDITFAPHIDRWIFPSSICIIIIIIMACYSNRIPMSKLKKDISIVHVSTTIHLSEERKCLCVFLQANRHIISTDKAKITTTVKLDSIFVSHSYQ